MKAKSHGIKLANGYSGTPLVKKLGIKPGTKVYLENAPKQYFSLLVDLPEGVTFTSDLAHGEAFLHLFFTRADELRKSLGRCKKRMAHDGVLWISWPKKSSKTPSDITEDVIRSQALPLGLVDVKVCAVDETWSGLKLMVRKELRTASAAGKRKK